MSVDYSRNIILAPRGNDRRELAVGELHIPDLWHVAEYLREHGQERASSAVLETWHIANDLKLNIAGDTEAEAITPIEAVYDGAPSAPVVGRISPGVVERFAPFGEDTPARLEVATGEDVVAAVVAGLNEDTSGRPAGQIVADLWQAKIGSPITEEERNEVLEAWLQSVQAETIRKKVLAREQAARDARKFLDRFHPPGPLYRRTEDGSAAFGALLEKADRDSAVAWMAEGARRLLDLFADNPTPSDEEIADALTVEG